MSLRKWCSPTLPTAHPLHCPDSPGCEHHWFYDFRVNRRRYRNTTETDNKQKAKSYEARERSRVLDGRQQIRALPDVTFTQFATIYLRDHAELHKKSVTRDREILKVLGRAFGSLILHEITAHRIEQFKRERLAGKWRGHQHTSAPKPIKPGTVNRELDTLRGLFSKAVEWQQIRDHPMRSVKRLKVDNRRTRILTEAEQQALLAACPKKLGRIVRLALITGRADRGTPGAAVGARVRHGTAAARDEERPIAPATPQPGDRCGAEGVRSDEFALAVHEPTDARSLHRQRRGARVQAGAGAGRHPDRGCQPAHAPAYGAEPDDCQRASMTSR